MAAKERADLLRSARRKILQNSICRQGGQTEIEFCKNFCRVLPLQGLAAKAGSPLQSRHQWERAGWNRRRCVPWRPDLLPLRQRSNLLVDAPLPIGSPAIALAALPARPPREGAPGCRRLRKRPAFAGAGWAGVALCGGSGMPRPGWRLRDQRDLRRWSWLSAPGGEDGKKTIFLRTTPACPSGLGRQGAGFLAGGGMPRRSSRQATAHTLAAGRSQARSPLGRRSITPWRGCVRRRSCGHRPAVGRPGQRRATFRANRECFGA